MTPKYTDEELAECASKAFDSKDYLGTPRWLRAFIAALPKRSGDSQLETELQTMTALADRLAEALHLGLTIQKRGDIWSVNPSKIQQFFTGAKQAIAAYENHKKQAP